MFKGKMSLGGLLGLGLMWVASCSSKDQCQGAERCGCYANGTCNAGLECRSNLCVANGNGQAGGTGIDTAACAGCAEKACRAEYDACNAASGCLGLVDCALGCGSDVNCLTACTQDITPETSQKLVAYETCALTKCAGDCVPNVGGVGGSAGTGGSAGAIQACLSCGEKACQADYDACKATSGCLDFLNCAIDCGQSTGCAQRCAEGVTPAAIDKLSTYQTCTVLKCASECSGGGAGGSSGTGGVPNGNSGAGGKPSGTSGSGGTTPTDPAPGETWLSLSGATAPSDSSPNDSLGIEGVFYAYADACTTPSLQWDEQTRCLSGELCLADELGENWGAAIGFDLDNRSDVKHAWSATTAGVSGFAWRLSGAPSGLQFWVQNMDPSFSGTCSAMSCSVNGPPDGTRSALNVNQLAFASMQKDYWGGGGVAYSFDPTNISSLQFKVPATIDSFSTTFELCVDALGVLR